MNTIYAKNDYIERENKRILNRIKSVLRICSPLDIYCAKEHDVWGIWFKLDDRTYLVDLLDLVNSIYLNGRYPMLEEYQSQDKNYRTIEIHKGAYCYSWIITGDDNQKAMHLCFNFQEYTNKIRFCVETLYMQWSNGNPVAYKTPDLSIEAVKMAIDQLSVEATLPTYYTLMTSDIKKESFVFNTYGHKHEEKYTIGIGNRKYDTWVTHWDNNFNRIRNQYENLYYEDDAEIMLSFDTSNTVLKIRKVSVLDEAKNSKEGLGFKYKDYALVEIQPNEFVYKPILKGYCDWNQTIKTLYEGFLLFALKHNQESIEDMPAQLDIYNMLKSPLIENEIAGLTSNEKKADKLQKTIKKIIKIKPNNDNFLIDNEGVACSLDDLYDNEGKAISLIAFEEWQQETHPIIIKSETGKDYEKDWQDYHNRGLELARQLRKVLSTDFDLWYDAPFEDKSGIISGPTLIIETQNQTKC